MLSPVMEFVANVETRQLDPRKMGSLLGLPLDKIAELARAHRNTVSRSPNSPQVQDGLRNVVRVLISASRLMEGSSMGRAALWFKNQPLSGFGGKTAMDLVREGKTEAVLEHLEMLADGVYA